MDRAEARQIAQGTLDILRTRSYEELAADYLNAHAHNRAIGDSGTEYQVEIDAIWDGREGGNLRVVVAIDDGGWTAVSPLIEDFIMAPDGSFVGE